MSESLDVCECGDYRSQHRDGGGPCKFNAPENTGHSHGDNCMSFQLDVAVTAATRRDAALKAIADHMTSAELKENDPSRDTPAYYHMCFDELIDLARRAAAPITTETPA